MCIYFNSLRDTQMNLVTFSDSMFMCICMRYALYGIDLMVKWMSVTHTHRHTQHKIKL